MAIVSEIEFGKQYRINTKKFREIYPNWNNYIINLGDYRVVKTIAEDDYSKVIFSENHDTATIHLLLKNNLVEEI